MTDTIYIAWGVSHSMDGTPSIPFWTRDKARADRFEFDNLGAKCEPYVPQSAVSAEREACAQVCDGHASCEGIAQQCADAIRARSTT